ncbi:unnamed protein product [Clonostachys rosea f. rosea IK726]|uniref:tRNA dimethylallyltransferase n=2 Tax=Bionectria ochroleuca TaxID=29856 RepID=A0A0B7K6J5_BIOOC|nr:unnamed protein product [Clonostachys rosea f. rosea IK726]
MFRRLGFEFSARRNVATMATPTSIPTEPLLVILGSTGTGKSELAVELATRFRGEIINADAMQLYNGLPIITNKITVPEQKGIPHHLLGHISLHEVPWDVDDYTRQAKKTIQEIRSRGNLPIVVGGTQYYVDPLIFKEVTLGDLYSNETVTFPILDEPTEVILAELRKVDPAMASRWHPNDRRKIQRSLEIYLRSGKPASEFYAEQQERKATLTSNLEQSPWENLMFWVYSEREVLKTRLDGRVDKMLDSGLLDEVRECHEFKRGREMAGSKIDMTRGIWQSIGYRQFEPYLDAAHRGEDASTLEELKAAALEDMKVATRRYANHQNRWTRLKQFPLLVEQGPEAVDSLYLLDSTDVSHYKDNVVEPAAAITAQFLKGEQRPHPVDISQLAREVLSTAREPPPKAVPCERTCEICGTVATTEEMWRRHVRGASHKRAMKKRKRLALVPVDQPGDGSEDPASERSSSPELGSIFS